jgi:hypothetical protein
MEKEMQWNFADVPDAQTGLLWGFLGRADPRDVILAATSRTIGTRIDPTDLGTDVVYGTSLL